MWARFVHPDGSVAAHKFSSPDICDSTTGFRLRNETDTSVSWGRNLTISVNARWQSLDPATPGFLTLDTAFSGSRDLLVRHGGKRSRVGALGADGTSSQEPVRVRTRGHGRLEKTKGELVLPVSITGRLDGVSRLVVRRIWVTARPIDAARVEGSTPEIVERRVLPLTLSDILPTDTLIRVPFSDAGADSLYQVDLWLAAIAGNDTLDATPMAWSAASVMGASVHTSGTRQHLSTATWKRSGQFLVLLDGIQRKSVVFFDANGARMELPVQPGPQGMVVDLAGLPRGLWHPRLQGSRPVVAGWR